MIKPMVELSISVIGLLLCFILFHHFPRLSQTRKKVDIAPSVSVIIPARNEGRNIANLLNDLRKQSLPPLEIIVVDDMSSDDTLKIAKSFAVKVIKIEEKPDGWLGKSWACQKGADAAKGDFLLFLDADVRLSGNALFRLIKTQMEVCTTISVQPYHQTKKLYEQFSMIFNIVQTAADGVSLPWKKTTGLFGPVILISKNDYFSIGGHQSVKNSIIEDIALGKVLDKARLKYNLYVSEGDISYQMYGDGFKSLFNGWTKNIASGASSMSFVNFLLVFLFIASLISVPSNVVLYAINFDLLWLLLYCGLYLFWVIVLFFISHKIGRFNPLAIILFPILVLFFTLVFIVSFFIKIFNLKYKWKGRSISGKR